MPIIIYFYKNIVELFQSLLGLRESIFSFLDWLVPILHSMQNILLLNVIIGMYRSWLFLLSTVVFFKIKSWQTKSLLWSRMDGISRFPLGLCKGYVS